MSYAGSNIDALCAKWNLSRDDLGKKVGLGRGVVASYVQGKAKPTVEFLWALERMTGIQMSRWFTGIVDMSNVPEYPRRGWPDIVSTYAVAEDAPAYVPPTPAPDPLPTGAALVDISALVAEVQSLRARQHTKKAHACSSSENRCGFSYITSASR